MSSDLSVQLAGDVLRDHFGTAVERVGTILLERGPLSLQDILRFANQSGCRGLFRFPQVRNALLTLVQHCIVVTQAHPGVTDAVTVVPHIYSIDVDEIFSRLRFPHFLEHIRWTSGDMSYHLVFAILKYGRATASVAIAEASRTLKNNVYEDFESELATLVTQGLLRAVAPYASVPAAVPVEDASNPEVPEEDDDGADGNPPKRRKPQPVKVNTKNTVYTYNRRTFNLCLCKNLLVRLVEERVNSHAAQVLAALLKGVSPSERTDRVNVDYLNLAKIEEFMKISGSVPAGLDLEKAREKLRKVLELLSAHKDGIVRKRVVQVGRLQAVMDKGKGKGTEQAEWAVEWYAARNIMLSSIKSQLIRDQFGLTGHRIFNLLSEKNPPQKLEEKDILQACMVPLNEGREILNGMCRAHVVNWQELPKSSTGPYTGAFWMYYVDHKRVELMMLQGVLQSLLNLRVRFRVESRKTAPLESRVSSLTSAERVRLQSGRRMEDILERSFLVLDSVLLVFKHF